MLQLKTIPTLIFSAILLFLSTNSYASQRPEYQLTEEDMVVLHRQVTALNVISSVRCLETAAMLTSDMMYYWDLPGAEWVRFGAFGLSLATESYYWFFSKGPSNPYAEKIAQQETSGALGGNLFLLCEALLLAGELTGRTSEGAWKKVVWYLPNLLFSSSNTGLALKVQEHAEHNFQVQQAKSD